MASNTHIFFTGATGMYVLLYSGPSGVLTRPALGYIGGSVLQRLLAHPKRDTFEITALVRSPDKAKLLNTFGVNTVVASLSDHDRLTELAAASNVVIQTVVGQPLCNMSLY
jgi:D-arabinose 1-dehydrogenase-like Zn-dependent alcohol dehydrogenase